MKAVNHIIIPWRNKAIKIICKLISFNENYVLLVNFSYFFCQAKEEFLEWKKRDPLKRCEEYLQARGGIQRESLEGYRRECEAEMAEALQFARESPFPGEPFLFQDIYCGDSPGKTVFS